MTKKKLFVLDTNVILHDSSCIYQFQEHDVVIPITVIEELDQFKKGNGILNFHAREFVRSLDALSGDKLFNGGVRIGPEQGRVSIKLEREFHERLRSNFSSQKPDHRVLNIVLHLSLEKPECSVTLVTKDVNLRMKAKAFQLMAEDYTTDHVKNVSELYKGRRIEEDIPGHVIDLLYEYPFEIDAGTLCLDEAFLPNEYVVLRNGKKSALAQFNTASGLIRRVDRTACFGISPRNAEQTFALNAMINPDIPLVTLSGKAGTGKTLLALAAALEKKRLYRQIFVARPTVPLSNKDTGFLPGDIRSKLDPYMQPLYDNLAVIQDQCPSSSVRGRKIEELLDAEKIVVTPLSYIRGRSLVKVFFIVDEAQNLTPHEVKTIITRAGEGTKIVFTGDIHQIDHPYLDIHSNGLSYLIEKMKDQPLATHINLEKGERSVLSELAINLL
ncbi:MAG: PhoH family protein [Desulfobacterales bacterium]|nr:PhoH family protein [Desulfobacterales bacterium]